MLVTRGWQEACRTDERFGRATNGTSWRSPIQGPHRPQALLLHQVRICIHSTHVSLVPHKIVLHAAASNYQNYEFQRACTIAAACQTEIDARRSLPCRERNCCGSARPLSSTYELLFEYSAPNSASADPFLALCIFPYFALGLFWRLTLFGLSPFPCARRAFRAVRVRRTRLPAVPS